MSLFFLKWNLQNSPYGFAAFQVILLRMAGITERWTLALSLFEGIVHRNT
jgi:hypothetical protein